MPSVPFTGNLAPSTMNDLLLDPVPYPELELDRGGESERSYLIFPVEGACFEPGYRQRLLDCRRSR